MIVSVFKITKVLIVLFLALPAMSQDVELSSTLHSTIYGVPVAYIDETVMFNCVVRESNSMAWTSEEYIGTGGQQLEFLAAERPGSTLTAIRNNRTIAELVNTTGREFVVSRLQITIKPNFQTASVRCRNINANRTASITFLLADDTSVTCDRRSVCPGETVTCTCTTGNSNTLVWTTNGNRLIFAANDPLLIRQNVNGSSTSAVLTENSDRNGIRVIMSNITFVASMSNVLICGNVDRSTSESVIVPVTETCADPFNEVTTTARNVVVDTGAGPIAAAVVVPVIIAIVATIIVIAVSFGCWKRNKDIKQNHDQLKTDLEAEKRQTQELKTKNENLDQSLRTKETNLTKEKEKLKNAIQAKDDAETKLTKEKENAKQAERKLKQKERQLEVLEKQKDEQIQSLESDLEKLKNPPKDAGSKAPSRKKKKSTSEDKQLPLLQLPSQEDEAEPQGSARLSPRSPKKHRPGSPAPYPK